MASEDFFVFLSVVFKKFGLVFNEFLPVICQFLYVLKTEDIHPPKTGISVHFSGSLV